MELSCICPWEAAINLYFENSDTCALPPLLKVAMNVRSPPISAVCTVCSIFQFGLGAPIRCVMHEGPGRAGSLLPLP
jgi:hypothetical protein